MVKGTTKSGFEFSLPETATDNMELIDAIAELTNGDVLAVSNVCRLVLGKDQRKKLYDHLRTEDGRVPTAEVEQELIEILQSFGDKGKNS